MTTLVTFSRRGRGALFLFGFVSLAVARADVITLVDHGKPAATIVVGSNESDQALRAADELRSFVERMSGATLEIRRDTNTVAGTRIFIGKSNEARNVGIELRSGFTKNMNEEGYVIRTGGDYLVLAGNEEGPYQGTLFAVYDLLERLGCRWFFPGPYGEIVPKRETVAIEAIAVTERPDFRFRNIWY